MVEALLVLIQSSAAAKPGKGVFDDPTAVEGHVSYGMRQSMPASR